jgi:DNA-binding transcriptional MerR regulator
LAVTIENLAEMLEVTSNTIANWELGLELKIDLDESGNKNYSDELIMFFKKVKSLILNGYAIEGIKDILASDIEKQNQTGQKKEPEIEKQTTNKNPETIIYVNNPSTEFEEEDKNENNYNSYKETFSHIPNPRVNKSEMVALFEAILIELKQYTERTIAAEKKVYLLEDYENRAKKEYFELSSEVKQLKTELEDKEKKLREFEEQKKRLNLMEVQLKIMQLEKNKKKFWEFWK